MNPIEISKGVSILCDPTGYSLYEFGLTHPIMSVNKGMSDKNEPLLWLNFTDTASYPLKFPSGLARDIAFKQIIHAQSQDQFEWDYEEFFQKTPPQLMQNFTSLLNKKTYQDLIKFKFPQRHYEELIISHPYNTYRGKKILTEDEIIMVYSHLRPKEFKFKDNVVLPTLAAILGKDENLRLIPAHVLHQKLFSKLKVLK